MKKCNILLALVEDINQSTRMGRDKTNNKLALSRREQEVLKCIKDGRCTSDISKRLGITERTVKWHIGNIMEKLNAKNRAHAVAKAMEKGFIEN